MANTMTLISSVTVGSGGAATISFSSIPATYTDLIVKLSGRFDAGQNKVFISFNGSTANLSFRSLLGTGSSALSQSGSTGEALLGDNSGFTANTFSNSEMYIPNYAGSNYKSVSADAVSENNGTLAYAFSYATLWSNTAAITSITLTPDTGANFTQYSTAYLYGVKNA